MANKSQLTAINRLRLIHDSRETQRAANDGVAVEAVVEGMAYTLAGISSNSLRMYDKILFPAIAILRETDSVAKPTTALTDDAKRHGCQSHKNGQGQWFTDTLFCLMNQLSHFPGRNIVISEVRL